MHSTEKILIDEIDRLKRYQALVRMINQEPLELSWEKIQNQRDFWKKEARKLVREDWEASAPREYEGKINDDF